MLNMLIDFNLIWCVARLYYFVLMTRIEFNQFSYSCETPSVMLFRTAVTQGIVGVIGIGHMVQHFYAVFITEFMLNLTKSPATWSTLMFVRPKRLSTFTERFKHSE